MDMFGRFGKEQVEVGSHKWDLGVTSGFFLAWHFLRHLYFPIGAVLIILVPLFNFSVPNSSVETRFLALWPIISVSIESTDPGGHTLFIHGLPSETAQTSTQKKGWSTENWSMMVQQREWYISSSQRLFFNKRGRENDEEVADSLASRGFFSSRFQFDTLACVLRTPRWSNMLSARARAGL